MIKSYRHNSLTYKVGESYDNPSIGYNKNKILSNNIITLASKELGQSWSPKYAPVARWRKDKSGQQWATAPDNWCADFFGWLYSKTHQRLPIFEATYDTYGWADYFINRNKFISPSNTPYESLGDLIQPGFYANVRHGGHAVIFLYWLDVDPFLCGESLAQTMYKYTKWDEIMLENLFILIDHANIELNTNSSNPDPQPGEFKNYLPINWCLVMNGNAGGGRVKKSIVPVVKLKKRDQNKMTLNALRELFDPNGDHIIHGVLWSAIGDWCEYEEILDDYYNVTYVDGFGNTR